MKKYWKILFFVLLLALSTHTTFAFTDGFWEGGKELGSSVLKTLFMMIVNGGTWVITYIFIAFFFVMTFVATFGILLLSIIIDSFLIAIPSISMFLGDDAGFSSYLMMTGKIYVFSLSLMLIIWLILGFYSYIKTVFARIFKKDDQATFNFFEDVGEKLKNIFLISLIPLILLPIKDTLNGISTLTMSTVTSISNEKDSSLVAKFPLTSLLTTGLVIPVSDIEYDEGKKAYEKFLDDPELSYSGAVKSLSKDSILDKSEQSYGELFDYAFDKAYFNAIRLVGVYSFIIDHNNIQEDKKNEEQGVSGIESWINSNVNGTDPNNALLSQENKSKMIFLGYGILYIVLLFMILMKLFSLVFKLVTRLVNIIINDTLIPLYVLMRSAPQSKKLGDSMILSYFGDLLVTPVISFMIGFGIMFFSLLISFFGLSSLAGVYISGNSAKGEIFDPGIIFIYLILLLFLYGIMNKIESSVETMANFENFIYQPGTGLGRDRYASKDDATQATKMSYGLSKFAGVLIGGGLLGNKSNHKIPQGKNNNPADNNSQEGNSNQNTETDILNNSKFKNE